MKALDELFNNRRLKLSQKGVDGGIGHIYHPLFKKPMTVVFSNGMGWDHVSVSYPSRTPNWEEMCIVKDIFFEKDEMVIQYHPVESEYVNNHPYTLHLWKPQNKEVPSPPSILVGVKKGVTK